MSNAIPSAYRKKDSSSALIRFLRNNGLTLTLMFSFLALWWGQSYAGWKHHNQEQQEHGESGISYGSYLRSGAFVEATAENWESEFLQMGAFVWLTIFLRQKGSPESKPIDQEEEVDREPDPSRPNAPWPVRRGGWVMKLYSHSLTLAFLLLFVISLLLHAAGGAREFSQQQQDHGQPAVSMLRYMGTSQFWFESLQNWQSEFLAIAAMVWLAVYLRQKGSPESKPVDAAHDEHE